MYVCMYVCVVEHVVEGTVDASGRHGHHHPSFCYSHRRVSNVEAKLFVVEVRKKCDGLDFTKAVE
jgi:hypothetical protein